DWCHVLNATALGVTFWLPPRSGLRLHVRCVSRVGQPVDVDHGKATTFSIVFRELGPESLKVPGMGLQLCGLQVWCWLVSTVLWLVLVERQLDLSFVTAILRGWLRSYPLWCALVVAILVVVPLWYLVVVGVEVDLCSVGVYGMTFHVLCFYSSSSRLHVKLSGLHLHVHRVSRVGRPTDVDHGKAMTFSVAFRSRRSVSSILDTLTPVFELYVRLRERRQRAATCVYGCAVACSALVVGGVVLVGLHCSLACACGATVGPFIRDCVTERLVEVLPVVVCPGGGDSSYGSIVVPRGVEVDLCSVGVCGMTFHVLCFYSSSSRLLVKLVASATSCCNDLPVRLVA
ncbi:hypothetical protein Taro_026296, partial [Colocasia esculenta]|nr:hypothetical protein [Colocasia esculenta]